jgi:hypothetical protein
MLTHNQRLAAQAKKKRARIKALRERGWTFERIGLKYGMSRQRAHQLWDRAVKESAPQKD